MTGIGSSPGLLRSHPDAAATTIRLMNFSPAELVEVDGASLEQVRATLGRDGVTWIDVQGFADLDAIEALGSLLKLHPLSLEDVLNLDQRPKVESYPEYLFIVVKMFVGVGSEEAEQLSLFLGPGWIVTFKDPPGDCLEPVRVRLRDGRPRVRGGGSDYLAYALIDAVVDGYFPVVEAVSDRLDDMEEEVLQNPNTEVLARLHRIKNALLALRRAAWPQRDAVAALAREDSTLIEDRTLVYLRDCHDHTIRLMDLIENHREVASGLVDLYMSSVSNRMNEVMKVLTIIATIFIPLGFIAGLYGMNFDPAVSRWNMPELGWAYGYPAALGVMVATAAGLLIFFKRKGWLGGS